MPLPDKDPETWTIEQVKDWAENTFTFGKDLGEQLVENDVDGSILLAHITQQTLKSYLSIKSLGQTIKILEAIKELRGMSLIFVL